MKIVVTGGASGLGEALVKRLVAHQVWILDVKAPAELTENHHYIELDLSNTEAIERVLSELPDTIDGLANVAGIAMAADPAKVIAVNFLGLRQLTESLVPRLSTGAAIASVSSIAGREWRAKYEKLMPLLNTTSFEEGMQWCNANHNQLARDPYTFSKRLVTAYTLRTAEDAIKRGYRINCVSPGPIDTPLYPEFESLMGAEQSEWTKAQTGRGASANDIAEVVDFLLTGECGWLNGVDIPVDGGYNAGMESGWIDFAQSPVMQNRGK